MSENHSTAMDAIDDEAVLRAAKDTLLDGDITLLTNNLAAEITNRTNADTALSTEFSEEMSEEVSARISGDLAVSTESSTAVAAVQAQIDQLDQDIIVPGDFAMTTKSGPAVSGDSVTETVSGEVITSSIQVYVNGILMNDGSANGSHVTISYNAVTDETKIEVQPSTFDLDSSDEIIFKLVKISA